MIISEQPNELFPFVYQLRIQDTQNKFTFDLLNGFIKPNILIDIFLANRWDELSESMMPTTKNKFRLIVGKEKQSLTKICPNLNEAILSKKG